MMMRLALYQPDIAGNVGAVLRLAACYGVAVDVIEPCGFVWSDAKLRRAGMDYAAGADLTRHAEWDAFRAATTGRIALLTTRGADALHATRFRPDDVLLLGSEGAGVPDTVHDAADLRIRIPLRAGFRSLNLGMSAGIALTEALRQTGQMPT